MNELKHAELVPVHKRNYRPVSILLNFSKVYVKSLYRKLYNDFENILFPSQYCLLVMTEKFKKAIDRGDKFGALVTDLSKAFDCINHPVFIAKIDSYGVSPLLTTIIFSYLSNSHNTLKLKTVLERGPVC